VWHAKRERTSKGYLNSGIYIYEDNSYYRTVDAGGFFLPCQHACTHQERDKEKEKEKERSDDIEVEKSFVTHNLQKVCCVSTLNVQRHYEV
jgi:hypothetical protein